jgi:hypothetical protein
VGKILQQVIKDIEKEEEEGTTSGSDNDVVSKKELVMKSWF